jgi:hypothetical protein
MLLIFMMFMLGHHPAIAAESIFIHLTANFKEDDGPVCVAFNAAWQALRDGDTVELFFDQEATYGIKQWEPSKTDLGLYPLPDKIKDLMAESFGVKRGLLPETYQEYLRFLHEQGVRVTANGFWNALTEVEKTITGRENILLFVEPLTLAEVLEHRRAATVYLKF